MTIRAEASMAGNPVRDALAACKRHFLYAGGYSAAINLLYLAPTIYMLQVYDRVVPTRGVATLLFLTVLLLASLAALALLEMLRARILVRSSARLERLLARPILKASLDRQFNAKGPLAMREFDTLRQGIGGAGVLALFDAPWTIVYVGLCFLLHPLLGGLAIAGSITLAILTFGAERATRPKLERANRAVAKAYAAHSQTSAVADVIRTLGMREQVIRLHERQRATVTTLQAEASFAAGRYMGLTKFIRLALQSLSLGAAAWLAVDQQISAGAIFAASLLVSRALSPLELVLGSWKPLVEAYNAYGSLGSMLGEATSEPTRTLLPPPAGHLSVDELTVMAPSGERPLLQNVSFKLAPGQVLGLVGQSGAGKSTLVRALVGAVAPAKGQIRLDEADLATWEPDRLGQHIGYLPQELGLLQGTVKQNICRFFDTMDPDRETIDAKVVEAAKACGAHEMILGLPQGYDTALDWGGRGVSLGQAQRIALARALYDEPRLIVLDEPNAHLDGDGEAHLLRALHVLKQRGAAVIIVAHRASMLAAMDTLLVLSRGEVTHSGPREEVLTQLNPARRPPTPLVHATERAA